MGFRPITQDQLGQLQPLQAPTQAPQSFGGGGNNQNLNQLILTAALLSGDVSAADIGALSTLGLIPSQQEQKEGRQKKDDLAGQQSKLDRTISDIDRAIGILETSIDTGNDVTGTVVALKKRYLKGQRGGVSEDTAKLDNILAEINKRATEYAGKAFTGTEKELFAGGIPEVNTDEQTLLTMLKGEREKAIGEKGRLSNLLTESGIKTTQAPKVRATRPDTTTRAPQPTRTQPRATVSPTSGKSLNLLQSMAAAPYIPAVNPEGMAAKGVRGTSSLLQNVMPMVLATMGEIGGGSGTAAMGGTLGSLLGTMSGESLENAFGLQNESPKELAKKTVTNPLKAGAISGASSVIIPRILGPLISRPANMLRNVIAARSPATFAGEDIANQVLNRSLEPGAFPTGSQRTLNKLGSELIDRLSGKSFSLPELLAEKRAANSAAYTMGGTAGRPITAQFNRLLGDVLRGEVSQASPAVSNLDKLTSVGIQSGRSIGNLIKNTLPYAAASAVASKIFGGR